MKKQTNEQTESIWGKNIGLSHIKKPKPNQTKNPTTTTKKKNNKKPQHWNLYFKNYFGFEIFVLERIQFSKSI